MAEAEAAGKFLQKEDVQIAAPVTAMIAGTSVYHFRFRPDLASTPPGSRPAADRLRYAQS